MKNVKKTLVSSSDELAFFEKFTGQKQTPDPSKIKEDLNLSESESFQ